MNKADRLSNKFELASDFPQALFISALNKDGLHELKERIAGMISV